MVYPQYIKQFFLQPHRYEEFSPPCLEYVSVESIAVDESANYISQTASSIGFWPGSVNAREDRRKGGPVWVCLSASGDSLQ